MTNKSRFNRKNFSKILNRFKADDSTGFGMNSNDNSGRYYLKDGVPNVKRKGLGWVESLSLFHFLMNVGTVRFSLLLFICFVVINLVFTAGYYIIGFDQLSGLDKSLNSSTWIDVFSFSVQTFTSVGYGRINPTGSAANIISSFESFVGLMSFALASGMFYARFSRPKIHLKFSNNALISPYKEGYALMFRMAPYKNNYLSDVEAKVTLATKTMVDGAIKNTFYNLPLEISKINMLPLSWTVVHKLDSDSPLSPFLLGHDIHLRSEETVKAEADLEILVFLKAFDETYSNQVLARTSYTLEEILWKKKFSIMYHPSLDHQLTVIDFRKLNDYQDL